MTQCSMRGQDSGILEWFRVVGNKTSEETKRKGKAPAINAHMSLYRLSYAPIAT